MSFSSDDRSRDFFSQAVRSLYACFTPSAARLRAAHADVRTLMDRTRSPRPRTARSRFRANEVRLLLGIIAYNLGNLLRRLAFPLTIQSWSLTSLPQWLFKTGVTTLRTG